ncbi:MAG: radical SAM protein [Methanobacteriota archaeon]|nr:MAG: radical SAM protein [Euryarchaeota archaeon]
MVRLALGGGEMETPKIVLTADKTLMSNYNGSLFLGFAACSPVFIPHFLFQKIFSPPVPKEKGRAKFASCGIRKVEAALLRNGFDRSEVMVVRPQDVKKRLSRETRVLGITTNDPLGLGPASSTFSDLLGKETYSATSFRELVLGVQPLVRRYGIKVLVGGPGAWQLEDKKIMQKYGIDSICVGEGEITGVEMIRKAVDGEELEPVNYGEVVPVEEIPSIVNPTVNGLVEIARGCGRGCRFCNPTLLNYRCIPINNILEEVKVNVNTGIGVCLHAEDVLRYGVSGVVPDEDKVLCLFREVLSLVGEPSKVGISHFAFSSVVSKPGLIEKLSEMLEAGSKGNPWIAGQVGIETGSPRLAEKHMVGKAKPFEARRWPEIVLEAHKILKENNWVPCSTIVSGLPGEKAEDIIKSIELVEELKEYKSLVVPLFFVPIGALKREKFFSHKKMLPEHWQLLACCMKHNFRWIYKLEDEYAASIGRLKKFLIKKVIKLMEKKLREPLKMMEQGLNPISQKHPTTYHDKTKKAVSDNREKLTLFS